MDSLVGHVDRAFLAGVAGPAPAAKKAAQILIINATAGILPGLMAQFGIDTPLRIAHFIAQIAHESDAFCTMREYASGQAYEGRSDLGNVRPGDGVRYRGRGLIQNTGRTNARVFTDWMRTIDPTCPDFEAEPERMEEQPWSVWVAIWYWTTRKLNVPADRDDLVAVTRGVNGGTNGLEHRRVLLGRGKTLLLPVAVAAATNAQRGFLVLHRGIQNASDQVECLQRLLAQAGYYHLAIDGDFGAGTEAALRAFQLRRDLKVDGLAGEKTFAALLVLLSVKRGAQPWTVA